MRRSVGDGGTLAERGRGAGLGVPCDVEGLVDDRVAGFVVDLQKHPVDAGGVGERRCERRKDIVGRVRVGEGAGDLRERLELFALPVPPLFVQQAADEVREQRAGDVDKSRGFFRGAEEPRAVDDEDLGVGLVAGEDRADVGDRLAGLDDAALRDDAVLRP